MTTTTSLTPLPHQLETIKKIDEKQHKKTLVILPSGAGKTHTIAFHVNKLKPKTFLYIVHRNEILAQTCNIFLSVMPDLKKEIGLINEHFKDFSADYLFATIQTLSRPKNLEKLRKKIDYVVIDEFHHSAADSYKRVLDYIQPKLLIGLSATPYRLDKKSVFGIVDNNVANEIDLFTGIQTDILVPFQYYGLWDNIDYSQIKFHGYSYHVGDLDRALIIKKRDEQVLKEYKARILPENRLTIAFCNSVAHVKRISSLFNANGIKSASITYTDEIDERKNTLELFRKGYYKILFTRDILNEGVDFPECDAVMFLRPTISKTIFFQQLGRGLRKREGKKDVLVLDFIGNYHKAFEKTTWLDLFIQHAGESTGKHIKPQYTYDPKCSVWFDSKVIDMFEIQKQALKSSYEDQMLALPPEHEEQIKYIKEHYVKPLQQKLGREYITQTDWMKEYNNFLRRPYWHGKNRFAEFRKILGIPSEYIETCDICKSTFKTNMVNKSVKQGIQRLKVCSPRCRGIQYYQTKRRQQLQAKGFLHKTPRKGLHREQVTHCLGCGIELKPVDKSDTNRYRYKYYCTKTCNRKHHYRTHKDKIYDEPMHKERV